MVGFKLHGKLPEGCTATDLVLTVTQMLRKKGVVGKFVEFYGAGLSALSLADRATIANMAPEYGATIGFFPVDDETLELSAPHRTGRRSWSSWSKPTAKEQGLFRTDAYAGPGLHRHAVELDLATVVPSLAGPKRPQDRVELPDVKKNFLDVARRGRRNQPTCRSNGATRHDRRRRGRDRRHHQLHQHLESVGDGRRRTAGEEGRRARADKSSRG